MKNRLLSIVLMLLFPIISGAQQVWQLPGEVAKDAIVRSVDSRLTLLYREGGSGRNAFLVYDGTATVSVFALPTRMSVRDVVVRNGVAYFCGMCGGDGAVGFFDVVDAYTNGSTMMNYAFTAPFNYSGAYMEPYEFTRLDVFEYAGLVHFAAVENTIVDAQYLYPSSTILSAFLAPGGTAWNCRFLYNKDALLRYSDIACLDSVIVAVGCDSYNTGCYVKTYLRTPFFVTMANALTPSQAQRVATLPTEGPVLVEKIHAGDFATAQFSQLKTATVLQRLRIMTDGTLSAFSASSVTPLSALTYAGYPWQLHDMVFDRLTMTIQLLERSDMPGTMAGFAPWKLMFPMMATATLVDGILLSDGDELSMDIDVSTSLPISAGKSSAGWLNFYKYILPNTTRCWSRYSFGVSNASPTIANVGEDDGTVDCFPTNILYVLEKEVETIAIECH